MTVQVSVTHSGTHLYRTHGTFSVTHTRLLTVTLTVYGTRSQQRTMRVHGSSIHPFLGHQTFLISVRGHSHGSQQSLRRQALCSRVSNPSRHGTSRHSQCPMSTQRRLYVVTGLQVTTVR